MNVLLTGATGRLGIETARLLVARGCGLGLNARNEDRLAALVDSLNPSAKTTAIAGDLTRPETVECVVEQSVAQLGGIDVLINNAASFHFGNLVDCSPSALNAVIQTNLTAVILLTRAALPYLMASQQGIIINIASSAGQNYLPGAAAYSASKHGLFAFAGSLFEEIKQQGVRVCTIAPGQFRLSSSDTPDTIPPREIAQLVEYLIHYPCRHSFPTEISLAAI